MAFERDFRTLFLETDFKGALKALKTPLSGQRGFKMRLDRVLLYHI
jgi:hypothetical protein